MIICIKPVVYSHTHIHSSSSWSVAHRYRYFVMFVQICPRDPGLLGFDVDGDFAKYDYLEPQPQYSVESSPSWSALGLSKILLAG